MIEKLNESGKLREILRRYKVGESVSRPFCVE